MEEIPPTLARAIVLRHLPRPLRAGLDHDCASGPLPAQLAADAEAVAGLGGGVAAWIREYVGACAGLAPWIGDAETLHQPGGDPADSLAALDRAAAASDDGTLREIADALILIGAHERLACMAGRAAAAAWSYLERLPETGAALHQLALATAGTQVGEEVDPVPWPELDPNGYPARRPDALERAETAWQTAIDAAFSELRRDARLLAIGLSAIAGGRPARSWACGTLAQVAACVGRAVSEPLTFAAEQEARLSAERLVRSEIETLRERVRTLEADPEPPPGPASEPRAVPPGHVVVCGPLVAKGPGKGKEVARGYEHAIGKALPLIPTPDLAAVRLALTSEFPYAAGPADAVLGAFAGRPHVHAPPLLVVGPPGAGKSRFVRRLGETLGVGVLRIDGANDGGGSFGGTERRWYSSEPCKPFMAVARYSQANPLLLVDEVDKAATRSEYGRLWDSMLQVLDHETASRFPDPSLQADLDLSWVSVVCTANQTSGLPGPLLDRMRIVRFPEPSAEHLDALLPSVLAAIAGEAGLDPRFHAPLDGVERTVLRARWRGGSVRRLRRAVEAVLRVRERALAREAH